MLSPLQLLALHFIAQNATDAPLPWLTSLGAFIPAAATLWWLYLETRRDRDRYRDVVFDVLPEYRDALRSAALAQEKLAATVEDRMLAATEVIRLRQLLDRLSRRRSTGE